MQLHETVADVCAQMVVHLQPTRRLDVGRKVVWERFYHFPHRTAGQRKCPELLDGRKGGASGGGIDVPAFQRGTVKQDRLRPEL